MDTIEATKMVMSRIQRLDPEHASKIMGYILIQDQGENEMIRLAFGPESHLVSVIKQAKTFLDISSNTSSAPSTPSLFTHRNLNSPQIIIPNNGFHHMNPPSPSSPWSLSGSFSDHHPHRGSPRPISYSSVVNGGGSSASSFYNNFNDHTEEYSPNNGPQVVPDQLSFFDESKNVDFLDNCGDLHHHHLHRRSCSVNDVFLGGGGGNDDIGGGWRPCMYFARGFCKNGTSCNFAHGNGGFGEELGLGSSSPTTLAGSPNGKIDAFEDLLRIKAIQQQQQRIAAMTGGGAPPFPFNRCMNFLNENPRLTIGDEFHKFGRRNDFLSFGNSNSSSRQIYLTFPADSTFKEEDVSNYFSMFGPVQDVRIPYQQKRMFGFVTFMLPETVKAILAKGNPHFVCDSRVLVKPYKEKGKIPDKKHQQQIERGDFSGCLSPTALESAEPFDHIPFGARMFNHEMILRRKLEERVELQHAIEFQDRRLMNLQLTEIKNNQFQSNSPVSDGNNEEVISGAKITIEDGTNSPNDESDSNMQPEIKNDDENNGGNGSEKDLKSNQNESDKHESSFEHNLPDNLFASPTKSAATNHQTIFPINVPENDGGAATNHPPPTSSTAIDMRASINSCTFKCQAIDM